MLSFWFDRKHQLLASLSSTPFPANLSHYYYSAQYRRLKFSWLTSLLSRLLTVTYKCISLASRNCGILSCIARLQFFLCQSSSLKNWCQSLRQKKLWQLQLSFVSSFELSTQYKNCSILMPSTFPKSCKNYATTSDLHSTQIQNCERQTLRESNWISEIPLLPSIHPPTPAKKLKLKNQQWKKFTSCHPWTRHTQAEAGRKPIILIPEIPITKWLQQLADCETYEMHYVLKNVHYPNARDLSMKSRWVEAGRKSAAKSCTPNSTPSGYL
jgi:hypothetical protein